MCRCRIARAVPAHELAIEQDVSLRRKKVPVAGDVSNSIPQNNSVRFCQFCLNETMNPPSLGYVILYVNDVAASLAFYEKAFGLPRRV